MTDGLGVGRYVAGCVSLVVVAAVLAWGAWRLRGALLPHWTGARARLAAVVIVLAVVIGLAQILGTFGAFRPFVMLAAYLAGGLGMGLVATRVPSSAAGDGEPPPRPRREEIVVALAASALIAAQWATHIAFTYGRGMTHPDTVWYHAPFAARFVESGSLTGLPDRSDVLQSYYPLNSSLVHALVELPFRSDLLAPMVNVGWAALALVAAWCIGRRRGVGPLCVLGAVVVLGAPMIAGTQPGQASNDVACSALLLAAVALLLEERLSPVPTALAGIAAGLAIATKLTVLAPVAVLTVGIIVLAVRGRRALPAIVWSAGVVVFGSYWYIRNVVEAHNPLPWFKLGIGPLSLPRSVVDEGDTIAQHLGDGLSWWRFLVFPGLTQAVGRAWPLILVIGLVSVIWALADRREGLERLVALAVLAGVVAYVFTPESAGLNFSFNVRYLTPALLVSFVLLPRRLDRASTLWRRVTWLVLLGLVALNTTARNVERVPSWPASEVLVGVLVGVGVVVVVGLLMWWRPRVTLPTVAVTLAVVLALVVVLGYPLQRRYLEDRYVGAGLPGDAIDEYFRGIRDSDVIVFGTLETYPMDGLDLSNRITVGQGPTTKFDADPCRQWPEIVAGKYRYVVFATIPRGQSVLYPVTPPREWFTADSASRQVFRDRASAVYRIDGQLHPPGC
ncbi:MAG TPA: hypothetical protein VKH36_14290 [Acidimicrobiia bacterium]|nr:hypothetical protein [Acidimicrobiia bacterium]